MFDVIRRLFLGAGVEGSTSNDNDPEPDNPASQLDRVPELPYSCTIPSFTDRKIAYKVKVTKDGFWSCSCPDFIKRSPTGSARSYYCKHCESVSASTGIPRHKYQWRSKLSRAMMTGDILGDGMQVYGYLTTAELYEKFTDGQKRKFLGEPDEIALFDDGGGCQLYSRGRVDSVLASAEYQQAREKYLASVPRLQAAAAKAKATRERKEQERQERRAAERAVFKGAVYVGKFEYRYGWETWGVLARDTASASQLLEEWLTWQETKELEKENFDDAAYGYREAVVEYREARKDFVSDPRSGVPVEPVKPLRKEFVFHLAQVEESDLDWDEFEINEIRPLELGGGWAYDPLGQQESERK